MRRAIRETAIARRPYAAAMARTRCFTQAMARQRGAAEYSVYRPHGSRCAAYKEVKKMRERRNEQGKMVHRRAIQQTLKARRHRRAQRQARTLLAQRDTPRMFASNNGMAQGPIGPGWGNRE